MARLSWQQMTDHVCDLQTDLRRKKKEIEKRDEVNGDYESLSDKDYFVFLDDDDILAPGAVNIVKREIAEHNHRPIMFRMINGNGELLWRTRDVTPGNVGGSMLVCPNKPGKLGKWANGGGHRSDHVFIEETLKRYGPGWRQNLFWSGDVIIHCRPEEQP